MAKRGSKERSSRVASPSLADDLLGHLTEDLVVEILSHLPAKSICRSKCVSRTWRDLISHPDHRGKLWQTLAGFFYRQRVFNEPAADLHFTNALCFANASAKGDPLFDYSGRRLVYLLDGCNGLLLLRCSSILEGCHYVVCNPATKQRVTLPETGQVGQCLAHLGFDPSVSPHFHVFEFLKDENEPSFRGLQMHKSVTPGVRVYSSSIGGWVHKENGWNDRLRYVHDDPPTVFLNGCLHLQTPEFTSSMKFIREPTVAVIDTERKMQRKIPVPDGPHIRRDGFLHLSKGCLHYVNFERHDAGDRLVVYVLENYDRQEWTLKHSVESSRVFRGRRSRILDFDCVAIHPDCNSIFFTLGRDKTLLRYDMDWNEGRAIKPRVICNLGDESLPPYLPYVPLYSELEALHM